MCYLGGSKLSKKSTFKFVPIRNGIEGLAATCGVRYVKNLLIIGIVHDEKHAYGIFQN